MELVRPVDSIKDPTMKKLNAVLIHVVQGNNCFQMGNVNSVPNTSKLRKLILNSAAKTLVILRRTSIFKKMAAAKLNHQIADKMDS
jgi:hypothetical protein